ncbi:hypothetical protein AB0O07_29200 [Streptomyces sp. NPDC093085]|uniref:hypothetical protein n=1 Tax=Streptomyces sp. NPDC093085 TaxID=3155068 RepID=UPI00341E18AF
MDLLDWHRGRLSSRRLAVLVKHMPRDSALTHELHGEEADWSVTDHLLAAAVDHLAAANWMFATVNTDENADPPDPPVPVPRPTDPLPGHPAELTEPPAPPASAASAASAVSPQRDHPAPDNPSRADLVRFFT